MERKTNLLSSRRVYRHVYISKKNPIYSCVSFAVFPFPSSAQKNPRRQNLSSPPRHERSSQDEIAHFWLPLSTVVYRFDNPPDYLYLTCHSLFSPPPYSLSLLLCLLSHFCLFLSLPFSLFPFFENSDASTVYLSIVMSPPEGRRHF